ncbi:serine hydrolase [Gramella sp. BOM4]|nr:serine hydrolase [Christiangramia bathymodioli]
MKRIIAPILLCFLLLSPVILAQKSNSNDPAFLKYENSAWVDSIMNTLSPDERIAQLIMVAAYSNRDEAHKQEILKLIKEQKIGGVIFFQGDPVSQAELMNDYQLAANVPLLGAIDAEWGLGMRLNNTISYPFQMGLGAIQNDSLLYEMGEEVARQVKRSGLHINLAPVVDVNNNPANPVINYRSFGEDRENVTRKGIAYMQGMQSQNVLTTAKHFPGHGDTATDSHYDLPQINHPRTRLDSIEIYPFKKLIDAGIGGVMVAHLDIPALDGSGVPSTLSRKIISEILKDSLEFRGVVITDAMNMKGVTKGNEPGVVDKEALVAGNDLLEFTEDVPKAISEVRNAIDKGLISQEEIDRRVRKILAVKQWVGLDTYTPTSTENMVEDLNTAEANLLHRKLVEAALTLLKNDNAMIPLQRLDTLKIASVSIGAEEKTRFQESLELYTKVANFQLPVEATSEEIDSLKERLKDYNLVIAGLHDISKYPRNTVGFSEEVQQFISELSGHENTIISLFKNPYVIASLNDIEAAPVLIEAYQDSEVTQEMAAQLIFGSIGASGKLPVSIGEKFKKGDGLNSDVLNRFKYTLPEEAGMKSSYLFPKVDSLMHEAINAKAIPGGQILIARNGNVVMHKAYGLHRYSDTIRVKKNDLYDLASVTKISSALPALMKLYDEEKFSLEAGIDDYLPYFRNSNKEGIPFRQILAHQARFKPWIPYWKNTLRDNGSFKWNTFKKDSSARYPIKISDELWLHRNYQDKIFKEIKKSPLEEKAEYKYSGLVFYLLPSIVEKITNEDYRTYLNENFYTPLGATTLTYNPMEEFPESRIVPTESDFNFRKEPIHGNVHDEGAIMMGGVSANAGLFANANDIAKLMQMYLNMGEYGGRRYISEATLKEFSRTQFPENDNRRALGFDKPNLEYKGEDNNTAKSASKSSFGHTGFTGTMVWVDPEYDLLYIFLSNRVLPTRENTRLYQLNTRTKIQQVIYDSIIE